MYRPVRAAPSRPPPPRARTPSWSGRARTNPEGAEAAAAARDQDKKHRDTTQLRLGRIRNPAELCENDGGGSGQPIAGLPSPRRAARVPRRDEDHSYPRRFRRRRGSNRARAHPLGTSCQSRARTGTTDAVGEMAATKPWRIPGRRRRRNAELHARRSTCGKARLRSFTPSTQLCPTCAEVNYAMRHLSCDLTGRVALLTGARVKIGFEVGLKLLRAGATLYATTRFPADCLARYEKEEDFAEWSGRLHVHAVDLRDVAGLERFCAYLRETSPRLDVIVNNACQTVCRPEHAHLCLPRGLDKATRRMTACAARFYGRRKASTTSGLRDDFDGLRRRSRLPRDTRRASRLSASTASERRSSSGRVPRLRRAPRRARESPEALWMTPSFSPRPRSCPR